MFPECFRWNIGWGGPWVLDFREKRLEIQRRKSAVRNHDVTGDVGSGIAEQVEDVFRPSRPGGWQKAAQRRGSWPSLSRLPSRPMAATDSLGKSLAAFPPQIAVSTPPGVAKGMGIGCRIVRGGIYGGPFFSILLPPRGSSPNTFLLSDCIETRLPTRAHQPMIGLYHMEIIRAMWATAALETAIRADACHRLQTRGR